MDNKLRPPHALLLEPNGRSLALVSALLEQVGFLVQRYRDAASLVDTWTNQFPRHAVVIFAHVDDGGLMLARLFLENASLPTASLVLLADRRDTATAIQAIRLRASDYLFTDEDMDSLRIRLSYLKEKAQEQNLEMPVLGLNGIDHETDPFDEETSGPITWDESLNAVRRGDTWISLSPIEWRLFHTLVNRRGSVVPLEDLVTKGLQREVTESSDVPLLRLHISRLRSKLTENFGHELNVVTLRGRGYMLV